MIFNNSRLREYQKCPRRYYWSTIRGLWSGYKGIDAEEGTLFHDMLAAWYSHKDEAIVRAVWLAHYATKSGEAEFEEEAEAIRERGKYMWRLFQAYIERYSDESFVVVDTEHRGVTCLGNVCYRCAEPYDETLIRGKMIQRHCDNCGVPIHYLVGKIDMSIIENGVLKVVDHKTKKTSASETFIASFEESSQMTQYMYILGRMTGRKVGMGVANIIVKLKKIAELGNPFKRNEEIIKTDVDYEIFEQDRLALIEEIEREMQKVNEHGHPAGNGTMGERLYCFRRNTDSCRDFKKCPYFDLCNPARLNWWEIPEGSDFEQRPADYVDDYNNLINEEIF